MPPRVVFYAPPGVTGMDLVGPLEVFQACHEAFDIPYRLVVCGLSPVVSVGGNLQFSNLVPFADVKLQPDDILFVSGLLTRLLTPQFMKAHQPVCAWIRDARSRGTTICSVCTGAYLLAEAGILDGLECATHWQDVDRLQRHYPKIRVRGGILFAEADGVYTSAGIASGIDLAIHLVGLRHGQKLAFEVAQYLVIYLRRSGNFEQESVYLRYRNHIDDLVHKAQTILIESINAVPSLAALAERVGASPRNLSRRFRQGVGMSVGEYVKELRLERARTLLQEKGSKVEDVARVCGFNGSRQLRNLFKGRYGCSPRALPAVQASM